MHRARIALTFARVAAGCSDGTSPTAIQPPLAQTTSESSSFTETRILQRAPTAPPLQTYQVSFWARHDKEATVAVDYQPAAGQSVGQPFLRFRIPKFGLKWGPDGARLWGSDSVLISLTIDTLKLSVDFHASGVVFSDVLSSGLVVWFAYGDHGVDAGGV